MATRQRNFGSWAVGGGLLAGLGVGFLFLETSALAFIACICIGLGLGLLAAAVMSKIGGDGAR